MRSCRSTSSSTWPRYAGGILAGLTRLKPGAACLWNVPALLNCQTCGWPDPPTGVQHRPTLPARETFVCLVQATGAACHSYRRRRGLPYQPPPTINHPNCLQRGVDQEVGAYLLPLIHDKEQR